VPSDEPYQPLRFDPALEEQQARRLASLRSERDAGQVSRRIDDLKKAATGSQNLLVPLREALRHRATVGEVCDALREVWGRYQPPDLD
jgi:methylmalonyl-CoA mutase N-terminal domain/subunit